MTESSMQIAFGKTAVPALHHVAIPPAQRSVIEISYRSDARFRDFVEAHPEALIYHHPAWLQALAEEYGREAVALACVDGQGRISGVLSLMETRGLPFGWRGEEFGPRLSSLPRTPCAGPLCADEESAKLLMDAALERVRNKKRFHLQIKSFLSPDSASSQGLIAVPWKYFYAIELPESPDKLRFGNAATRHRINWAVKKAQKLGVEVRPAETEAELAAWYRLHLETMRWHCAPPRPYRFFAALWRLLKPTGQIELLLAEIGQGKNRQLLSGYLLLKCSRTVHCYVNGRRRERLGLHPNDLLQWHAIHSACSDGFSRYDFGEVDEGQSGLAEFKTKWGARSFPSFRYYYPQAPPAGDVSTGESSLLRKLARSSWQHVPLSMTEVLGDKLYRYL